MMRKAIDELKQQIPLRDYLEAHAWRPVRRLSRDRWMGLCPLHNDHTPSFLMDPSKNLFYCYGCLTVDQKGELLAPVVQNGRHPVMPKLTLNNQEVFCSNDSP